MSMHSCSNDEYCDDALLDYLKDAEVYKREKPYILAFDIPLENEEKRNNLKHESRKVRLRDLRECNTQVSVQSHGFELLRISERGMHEFFSGHSRDEEIIGVTVLLRERFATQKVFCYDHAVGFSLGSGNVFVSR
jgi:hypothetical protein